MKSTEANLVKVRREIVKILLYQIGGNRQLSTFELQTVINSKLRENKIKEGDIVSLEIIEDLVSETISNPLIDDKRKETILENLKDLHNNSKSLKLYEIINKNYTTNVNDPKQEQHLNEINPQKEEEKLFVEMMKFKSKGSISNMYAFISSILIMVLILFSNLIPDSNLKDIYGPMVKFMDNNAIVVNLTLGILVSIVSAICIVIFKKFDRRRKDK